MAYYQERIVSRPCVVQRRWLIDLFGGWGGGGLRLVLIGPKINFKSFLTKNEQMTRGSFNAAYSSDSVNNTDVIYLRKRGGISLVKQKMDGKP